MVRLCLFDCDGTLVDSQHTIVAAMQAAFRAVERPPPSADAVRGIVGLSLTDAVAALLGGGVAAADTAETARVAAAYLDALKTISIPAEGPEPLFPGVRDGLGVLDADGWLLGIATGKSRRALDETLSEHALVDRFVTLQTADRAPGKPAPDMVLRAIAETGTDLGRTVVIGDSIFDMQMATHAGAMAIGVAWGYHPVEALRAAGASAVAGSFTELLALLARWWDETDGR
jgi:haloacid dehalogenase superfamily, subfamily IA, variant 1 with third motif having Dx(3-4)D or Dx(3-4)E